MGFEKQIAHWRAGADEAFAGADTLFRDKRNLYALFFCHLGVEKALKAMVMEKTGKMAPFSHDLVYLARLAGIEVPDKKGKSLTRINSFCMEGRYGEALPKAPNREMTSIWMEESKNIRQWLEKKFEK